MKPFFVCLIQLSSLLIRFGRYLKTSFNWFPWTLMSGLVYRSQTGFVAFLCTVASPHNYTHPVWRMGLWTLHLSVSRTSCVDFRSLIRIFILLQSLARSVPQDGCGERVLTALQSAFPQDGNSKQVGRGSYLCHGSTPAIEKEGWSECRLGAGRYSWI